VGSALSKSHAKGALVKGGMTPEFLDALETGGPGLRAQGAVPPARVSRHGGLVAQRLGLIVN
jgi:hypothetical protein